jgi:hypothetical protein
MPHDITSSVAEKLKLAAGILLEAREEMKMATGHVHLGAQPMTYEQLDDFVSQTHQALKKVSEGLRQPPR